MANSKLIVVEGPQGAGKTTITDYLRYAMSYTNFYMPKIPLQTLTKFL